VENGTQTPTHPIGVFKHRSRFFRVSPERSFTVHPAHNKQSVAVKTTRLIDFSPSAFSAQCGGQKLSDW